MNNYSVMWFLDSVLPVLIVLNLHHFRMKTLWGQRRRSLTRSGLTALCWPVAPAPSAWPGNAGLWLVKIDHVTWILASDWQRKRTHDLNASLWLVEVNHVTWILNTDWLIGLQAPRGRDPAPPRVQLQHQGGRNCGQLWCQQTQTVWLWTQTTWWVFVSLRMTSQWHV